MAAVGFKERRWTAEVAEERVRTVKVQDGYRVVGRYVGGYMRRMGKVGRRGGGVESDCVGEVCGV